MGFRRVALALTALATPIAASIACGESLALDPLPAGNDAGVLDATASDGSTTTPPSSGSADGGDAGALPNTLGIVFVTRATANGILAFPVDGVGSFERASNECAVEAEDAGLGNRTFVPWLSGHDPGPIEELATSPGWRLNGPDGGGPLVAASLNDLLQQAPATAIDRDARGQPVDGPVLVWTGLADNGVPTTADCEAWSSIALAGTAGDKTDPARWTNANDVPCGDTSARVYCFEK